MLDRSKVGWRGPPVVVPVERWQLKLFAKAVSEPNSIYRDEAEATTQGHRATPAPLTFAFCLAAAAQHDGVGINAMLGVDTARILHGEQAFEYHEQIHAGDQMTLSTTLRDIVSKKNGELELIISETSATNQLGVLCATMEIVTVVRGV